ncbi:hypothetical protein PIROE2DRAFT_1073, partial [Piromyces sp. E2]
GNKVSSVLFSNNYNNSINNINNNNYNIINDNGNGSNNNIPLEEILESKSYPIGNIFRYSILGGNNGTSYTILFLSAPIIISIDALGISDLNPIIPKAHEKSFARLSLITNIKCGHQF